MAKKYNWPLAPGISDLTYLAGVIKFIPATVHGIFKFNMQLIILYYNPLKDSKLLCLVSSFA